MSFFVRFALAHAFCLSVLGVTTPTCKLLEKFNLYGVHEDGDIIIGGLFPIHFSVSAPELSYKAKPEDLWCEG